MNGPQHPRSDGSRQRGAGRPSPAMGQQLSGEDRAGAVARTYARGPRRLQLTASQLRYIAREEQRRRAPAR